eukprot:COSAG05_NODE_4755_length_1384_cov_1.826459_2_plen_359_part_01
MAVMVSVSSTPSSVVPVTVVVAAAALVSSAAPSGVGCCSAPVCSVAPAERLGMVEAHRDGMIAAAKSSLMKMDAAEEPTVIADILAKHEAYGETVATARETAVRRKAALIAVAVAKMSDVLQPEREPDIDTVRLTLGKYQTFPAHEGGLADWQTKLKRRLAELFAAGTAEMKKSLSSKDITAVESCLVRFGPPVGGSNEKTKPVDFTSAAKKLARHRDRLIEDMAKQLAALLSRGGSRDPTELQRVLAAAEPYRGSDGKHRKVETQRKLVESHYAAVVQEAESALKTALVDADNLRELERVAAEHILFHSPHPQDVGEGAAAPHAHCGQLLQRLEAKIAAVASGMRDRVRTASTGSAPD